MEKRTLSGMLLILLLIGMLTLTFNVQRVKAEPQLSLETDKDVYVLGENVTIVLTNIGNETVHIGGYPAWQIYTYPQEEPVFPWIFATLAWSLEPGENDSFTWPQYNEFTWSPVETGTYVVRDLHGWGLSAFFEIVHAHAAPNGGAAIWVEPDYVNGTKVGLGLTFVVEVWLNVSEMAGDPEHPGVYAYDYQFSWNDTLLKIQSYNVYPPTDLWIYGVDVMTDVLEDTDGNAKNDRHWYVVTALNDPPGLTGVRKIANYTLQIIYEPVPPEPDMSCNLSLPRADFADFNGGSISPVSVYGGIYIITHAWEYLFGDFDGDGDVDIFDLRKVAKAFGSAAVDDPETTWDETQYWNPEVDVAPEGGDGKIDIFDVRAVAKHYGEHV